jgi:hypothetical protein
MYHSGEPTLPPSSSIFLHVVADYFHGRPSYYSSSHVCCADWNLQQRENPTTTPIRHHHCFGSLQGNSPTEAATTEAATESGTEGYYITATNVTSQPDQQQQQQQQPASKIMVGAYHPWQKNHFARGQGYLRADGSPRQEIRLGEYHDDQPQVIQQHIA